MLSFDPDDPANAVRVAAFRSYYGIGGSVQLVGPYADKLSNGGERVQLQRPDEPPLEDPTYTPHMLADEIDYSDVAPWPTAADGTGSSLTRQAADLWGDQPASWTAETPTPGRVDTGAASVAARSIFYNNSWFDGNLAAANAQDDAAIATDKTPLFPGQIASLANYTSYSRGINGIMIDLIGAAQSSLITAADFAFKVGNSSDAAAWLAAPAPTQVVVRPLGGGVDRVTILWADNAIDNKWLQVSVLATAHTGLLDADVFSSATRSARPAISRATRSSTPPTRSSPATSRTAH